MSRCVEYKMPKDFMKEILKKNKNRKISAQQFLCDYVQQDCNPIGKVIKVIGE